MAISRLRVTIGLNVWFQNISYYPTEGIGFSRGRGRGWGWGNLPNFPGGGEGVHLREIFSEGSRDA